MTNPPRTPDHSDPSKNPNDGDSTAREKLPRARSVERREYRRQRVQQAPRRMARSFVRLPGQMNPVMVVIIILLVAFLAVSLATPLRNYFQQRTELANLQAKIEQQEQQKTELTEELNRFNNDEYLKEQARVRLGVVEPGESAFRIISPKIQSEGATSGDADSAKSGEEEAYDNSPWFTKLWDSIAVEREDPKNKKSGPQKDLHVPVVPEDPPAPSPEQ